MTSYITLQDFAPVLEYCLSIEELEHTIKQLIDAKCICGDLYVDSGGNNDLSPSAFLIQALQKSPAPQWSYVFSKTLQNLGKEQLDFIFCKCLTTTVDGNLLWVIKNWRALCCVENIFENLADLVKQWPPSNHERTLGFAYLAATAGPDSKIVCAAICILQRKLKQNDERQKHFIIAQSILMRLQPMLVSCLMKQSCVDIARALHKLDRISEENCLAIDIMVSDPEELATKEMVILILCQAIAEHAQQGWEKDLVETISKNTETMFGNVLNVCFYNKARQPALLWIAANWSQFIKRKNRVENMCANLFNIRFQPYGLWLQHLMISVSQVDEMTFRLLMMSLEQILSLSEDFIPSANLLHVQATAFHQPNSSLLQEFHASDNNRMRTEHGTELSHQPYASQAQQESSTGKVSFDEFALERAESSSNTAMDTSKDIHESSSVNQSEIKREAVHQQSSTVSEDKQSLSHKTKDNNVAQAETTPETKNKDQGSRKDNSVEVKTRSQTQKEEIAIKEDCDCGKDYACDLNKIQVEEDEHQIEFRVVVNHDLSKGKSLFVYVDNLKIFLLMHEDKMRSQIFHAFTAVPKATKCIFYKYLLISDNEKEKRWENIPYEGIVNRKVQLDQGARVLFDVTTFHSKNLRSSTFTTMCAKHVEKHLPSINMIRHCDESDKMPLQLFADHIDNWWQCAKHGVSFAGTLSSYQPAKLEPSCNAVIRTYLDVNCQSEDVYQRVLGYAAILLAVCKYDIKLYSAKSDPWSKIAKGLCLHVMEESICKEVYDAILDIAKDPRHLKTALDHVMENIGFDPCCLFLFPLCYVVMNDGSSLYQRKNWIKAKRKFETEQHLKKLEEHSTQKKLIKLKEDFKTIIQALPKFVKIYQKFLKFESAAEILQQDADFYDLFIPVKLFHALNARLTSKCCQLLLDKAKLRDWIFNEIEHNVREVAANKTEKTKKLLKAALALPSKLCGNVGGLRLVFAQQARLIHWSTQICLLTLLEETTLLTIAATITNWMNQLSFQAITKDHVLLWNNLVSTPSRNADLTSQWKKWMCKSITKLILQRLGTNSDKTFEVFMEFDKLTPHKDVETCFSEAIYEYATKVSKDSQGWSKTLNRWMGNSGFHKLVPILSNLMLKEWNKQIGTTDEKVIQFLKWPFASNFFKLFGNPMHKKLLSNDCSEAMDDIRQSLCVVLDHLEKGELNVQETTEICGNVDAFMEGTNILSKKTDSSVDARRMKMKSMQEVVAKRVVELNSLQNFGKETAFFSKICSCIGEDCLSWMTEDISKMRWREVINLDAVDNSANPKQPEVTLFGLDDYQKICIREIFESGVDEHEYVRSVWMFYANEAVVALESKDRSVADISVDEVIKLIWNRVKSKICALKTKLDNGLLSFGEVDENFTFPMSATALRKDVELMIDAVFLFPDYIIPDELPVRIDTSDAHEDEQASEEESESDTEGSISETTDVEDVSADRTVVLDLAELPFGRSIAGFEEISQPHCSSVLDQNVLPITELLPASSNSTDCTEICLQEQAPVTHVVSDVESDTNMSLPVTVALPQVQADDGAPDNEVDRRKFRIDQICTYFLLKHQQETTETLFQLKETLQLEGDFESLETLEDEGNMSSDKTVSCITSSIIGMGRSFDLITNEHSELIRNFVEHRELTEWLRENMKDRSEVKVLSDLAMISAGDTALDVDKVACFTSAVMGFAPFLFDLPENSGLDDVIRELNNVWEYNKRDKNFLTKWVETSRCLEWLKGIKDFHGSVEKSSLLRAQQINSHGIYIIEGKGQLPTVEGSVELRMNDEKDSKKMTLSELHDLQSRLMLIADKGLDDVKHFITNLSHVENLAKAFVNLKVSGCLLFNNWTASLRCKMVKTEESSKDYVSLEITFDDGSPRIVCQENVINEMISITHTLEDALKRWKANLAEKRSTFYHLNYFNIQQISYLCQKLAYVTPDGPLPDQVYTLLSLIKPDISHAEIVRCLGEATEEQQTEDDEEHDENVVPEIVSLIDIKRKLVKRLIEEDIPEVTAKAGVQFADEDDLDYDDIFLWCLDHEFDEDSEVGNLCTAFDQEIGFDSSISQVIAIESVVKDRSKLTLQGVIRKLMDEYGESSTASVAVKTICERYMTENAVTSLSDCISLMHFGQFVENIGSLVEDISIPRHELPAELPPGNPHLIICADHDTIPTVLSLYMRSHDQPLPSSSEVLLCHNGTTKSDVELILRRTIAQGKKTGKRLYCIAGTENLNFEVANSLETTWQQLKKTHVVDYQLVIICSNPHHFISSLFHECKADYTLKCSTEEIQNYLETKLQLNDAAYPASVAHGRSVTLVSSKRAGLGKSLHISRLRSKAKKISPTCHVTTIRFLEKACDPDDVMHSLLSKNVKNKEPHFVHIDVTPSVENGIDRLLFNLLLLGSFENGVGTLWRKQPQHLYCIEYTFPESGTKKLDAVQAVVSILPCTKCITPKEVLQHGNITDVAGIVMMDTYEFESPVYQRPYQYLLRYTKNAKLDTFSYTKPVGTPRECLDTLLKYCSLSDPTWSELRHFASFLNCQLEDCEESVFCNAALVGADSGLAGFKKFVVKFMIRMSQDFATPSLKMSDSDTSTSVGDNDVFELHQLRRRWEEGSHPYLFFNEDRMSMSFVNFKINQNGDLLCLRTNECLEARLMDKGLVQGLRRNKVNLNEDFDRLEREQKLETLRRVFGIQGEIDPDPTYELTTDNVLKMLAIHMRFRCNIPVVVMGETGCGKTRMVEFMSKLKAGKMRTKQEKDETDEAAVEKQVQNMVIVKVHGGITVKNIQEHMEKAVELAQNNQHRHNIDTMLFLDEANTTEAIYAIKEFVCDGSIHGEMVLDCGLRIVAACNPYRMHDKEAIEIMEAAGLGFRVKADDTADKLGDIPMRCLVYRVIALPPSMQALVWDFGQLQNEAEKKYIEQMIHRLGNERVVAARDLNLMVDVLVQSQTDMRQKRNEAEKKYIEQMIHRLVNERVVAARDLNLMVDVLVQSQTYMRQKRNEAEKKYIEQMIHRLGNERVVAARDLNLMVDVLVQSQTYMRQKRNEAEKKYIEQMIHRLGNERVVAARDLNFMVDVLVQSQTDMRQKRNEAEKKYIEQMIHRLGNERVVAARDLNLMVDVLVQSQTYMRQKRNECHFVSLRDVERCLVSFKWFSSNGTWLFPLIDEKKKKAEDRNIALSPVGRCLIHAVGMCYHVTLGSRSEYRQIISDAFSRYGQNMPNDEILDEIVACQLVFLRNIELDDDVARNEALRENVFMMVMCTEMRIPLFLIGKPGSSKSLAKTVVTAAMQGLSSSNHVFQRLKQIQVLSFQCSPVSDAMGIEGIFRQCLKLQETQDPEKFVAVAVLDEIGLAEDSPKMPLKVLHPLLESGSTDGSVGTTSELITKETVKRVGFVGISNWALDPAKMNRGVFVHRGAPTKDDLKVTAKGIFTSEKEGSYRDVADLVDAVTESYWEIYDDQEKQQKEAAKEKHAKIEFFGLRDYYGLLKMIFFIVSEKSETLTAYHVAYAILRNFSGGQKDYSSVFWENLEPVFPGISRHSVPLKQMLKDNLKLDLANEAESRYLLLMSNHFAAIDLLSEVVDSSKFQVIFGSSFPQDNNYTEVCRNINRIKMCMESGRTVVLLNLRDLYESLYDALNQHYVTFAGQRYVDLGLGGHRVKCRVAENFRLIVIEDMDVVYTDFPIPLINRLEKHIFTTTSILDSDQIGRAQRLQEWVALFSKVKASLFQPHMSKTFTVSDAFVGYTSDTSASAVLAVGDETDAFEDAQILLLLTATMDSVFRLERAKIPKEVAKWQKVYLEDQHHDNLLSLLGYLISCPSESTTPQMVDVVTFSQILSENDRQKLEHELRLQKNSVMLLTLQQFQTAEEYTKKVSEFLSRATESGSTESPTPFFLLLIQCPQANTAANLIACSKYIVQNLVQAKFHLPNSAASHIAIAFLHTLERDVGAGNQMKSFLSSRSHCVFVDELRISSDYIGFPSKLWKMSLHAIFQAGLEFLQTRQENNCSGSNFGNPYFCVDLARLINNCVSMAVVKLRRETEAEISTRVKNLVSLFSKQHMVSQPFILCTANCIVDILEQRENEVMTANSWMIDEACSQNSLNEGGSFTKTLWIYLKKLTSTALAYVISKADEDQNLDLLWDSNDSRYSKHVKGLWLKLFQLSELCQFKWRDIAGTPKEFLVKSKEGFKSTFPFSRSVIGFFHKHWEAFQHADKEKQPILFHKAIRNTKLNPVLKDAESSCAVEVQKSFIHDLVCLQYQSGSGTDLERQLVANMIFEIFKTKQQALEHSSDGISNLMACVFVVFKSLSSVLRQVANFSTILPEIVTQANVQKWSSAQEGKSESILQVLMFDSVLDCIQQQSGAMKGAEDYYEWSKVIGQLRVTAQEIIQHPQAEQSEKVWKALEFADLFLDQLIPQGLTNDLYDHYIDLLIPLSKRLWKGAAKAGLRTKKFLNIVVKTLTGCSKEVGLKHLLKWQDLKCKVCKKLKVDEPVLLPCGDYMCLTCIQILVTPGLRQCPVCRDTIQEDFEIRPAQLHADQVKHVETFTANCTSFFLEYLSTLCFPAPGTDTSGMSMDENITDSLHKLVIVEESTKDMSPVETSSFDDTPTVRSFILQLLLRYGQEKVEVALEKHFVEVGSVLRNKYELMMIYIRCIEDSLRNKSLGFDDVLSLIDEQVALAQDEDLKQIQHLNITAKLRFSLDYFCDCVYQYMMNNEGYQDFVTEAAVLLQDVRVAKSYFVKIFCRRYGSSYFPEILQNDLVKSLIPSYLRPAVANQEIHAAAFEEIPSSAAEAEISDMLVVEGNTYSKSKRIMETAGNGEELDEAVGRLTDIAKESTDALTQVLLATLTFAQSSKRSIRDELVERLVESLSNVQNSDNALNIFAMLNVENLHGDESQYMKQVLNDLIAAVCLTVSASSHSLIEELRDMMTDPTLFDSRFLPTMPQSNYFSAEVRGVIAQMRERHSGGPPKEYLCPNGHQYFIGDCTNPVLVNLRCPDCKERIGGDAQGILLPGNSAGKLQESSQAGYKIPLTKNSSTPVFPERTCNRTSVCTLRFLLHAIMGIASKHQHAVLSFFPNTSQQETETFLRSQLKINLQQLADCLGKSLDDSVLLLHQLLKNIREHEDVAVNMSANLRSMDGRKIWESEFQRCFLVPIFSRVDEAIGEAQRTILDLKQKNDLDKLVYELPEDEDAVAEDTLADTQLVEWNNPCLWKFQINVSINHLRQKLEGTVTEDEADGAVVQLILDKTSLPVVSYLEKTLKIQRLLLQRYQRKVDTHDVENIRLQGYLDEPDCLLSAEDLQFYVDLWNENKEAVGAGFSLPAEYSERKMDMDSPISMCLPSRFGGGLCALAFTEYIIDQQNGLLHSCRETMKSKPSFASVSVDQLTSNDLVCIENDRVLLPYVLANSQYEATTTASGSRHKIVYRIPALEKQITQRFVLHKKLIDKTSIPCMEYLQDVGIESECEKLKENVAQKNLSIKLVQKLEEKKRTARLPDICEAVRTLTLVIKYLSNIGSDGSQPLCQYVRDDLMLSAEEVAMIPASAKLCHTLALFEWFSCQRSIKYVASNQDPFKNVVFEENRAPLEDLTSVREWFSNIQLDQLQLELNSLLVVKSELHSEISLKEYLEPFLEEKEADTKWIEEMPEEILVKHAVSLFELSVRNPL